MIKLLIILFFITSTHLFANGQDCKNCELSLIETVKTTLNNSKQIEIQYQNIDVQAGLAQQAAGPFDPVASGIYSRIISITNEFTKPPPKKTKFSSYNSQVILNYTKQSRIGTIFTATAEINDIHTSLKPNKIYTESDPSVLSFRIQQPLLRHFLTGFNTMEEKAQRLQVSVAWYSTVYFISSVLTNSVSQYWELVAAKKLIGIQEEAVEQYKELIEKIKGLIKGQLIAGVDINQAMGQLAEAQVDLITAKQLYTTALQNLKFLMGKGDACFECNENEIIVGEYPLISDKDTDDKSCEVLMKLSRALYKNRADITASEFNEEANEMLLIGSENESLPDLSLFGNYNLSGRSSITRPPKSRTRVHTDEVSFGVIFSTPLYNDFALGLIQQYRALRNQARLQTQLLKEQMSSSFLQLWRNHYYLIQQIKEAELSIKYYQEVVESEIKKLNAGYSSVFIVLDLQKFLIDAKVIYNEAYKIYAQNIIQFRLVTGTILRMGGPYCCFEIEPLMEWPNFYE